MRFLLSDSSVDFEISCGIRTPLWIIRCAAVLTAQNNQNETGFVCICGHVIWDSGVKTDPKKVQDVKDFAQTPLLQGRLNCYGYDAVLFEGLVKISCQEQHLCTNSRMKKGAKFE